MGRHYGVLVLSFNLSVLLLGSKFSKDKDGALLIFVVPTSSKVLATVNFFTINEMNSGRCKQSML